MDDYTLMIAKMRGEKLLREAARRRLATQARRAGGRRQMVPAAARGLVIWPAHRLAMATARMRPTTTGR
jgi:hypothetical protein